GPTPSQSVGFGGQPSRSSSVGDRRLMRGLKCPPAEAVRSRVVASSGHLSRQFPAVRESLENTGDAPPAGQLPLGTVVAGRYVIRRMLGHGGAASVYAAEHLVVKRSVALKLPHLDLDLRE